MVFRIPCLLRLTVWSSIWIVQIILVAGSYVLVSKADALEAADSNSASTESKTQVLLSHAFNFIVMHLYRY